MCARTTEAMNCVALDTRCFQGAFKVQRIIIPPHLTPPQTKRRSCVGSIMCACDMCKERYHIAHTAHRSCGGSIICVRAKNVIILRTQHTDFAGDRSYVCTALRHPLLRLFLHKCPHLESIVLPSATPSIASVGLAHMFAP